MSTQSYSGYVLTRLKVLCLRDTNYFYPQGKGTFPCATLITSQASYLR